MAEYETQMTVQAGARNDFVGDVIKRFAKAQQVRKLYENLFEECHDLALPNRTSFYSMSEGQSRTIEIFDETAVVGVAEFASRMQTGLVPQQQKWVELRAGLAVPPDQREQINRALEDIRDLLFDLIDRSNFYTEIVESFTDLAVSTAVISITESDNDLVPFRFESVPLSHIYYLSGPYGTPDQFFRPMKKPAYQIGVCWPGSIVPQELKGTLDKNPTQEVSLLEHVYRDWSMPVETWRLVIIEMSSQTVIYSGVWSGDGSQPIVAARWSKVAGETWGRGPMTLVLPAVRNANLLVEMTLQNAELAVAGLWQAEDDGVINPDTVRLDPGTVIPIAPGSSGIQPLQSPSRFDVGQVVLNELRFNIKKGLFNETIGPREGTPASATEIQVRMSELARAIGGAYTRIVSELLHPLVRRCLYIMRKRGLITLPSLGERVIEIVPTSPLARAVQLEDVMSVDRWMELTLGRFGPEQLGDMLDTDAAAKWLAEKMGVPAKLMRTPGSTDRRRRQRQEAIAQQQALDAGLQPQAQIAPSVVQ